MRNFKTRISKLEKNIKPTKTLYKIYWAMVSSEAAAVQHYAYRRRTGNVYMLADFEDAFNRFLPLT